MINHDLENLSEAIGVSSTQLESLKEQLVDLATNIYSEKLKPSHAAEYILNNISYNELVFIAVQYLLDKIEQHQIMEHTEFLKAAIKKFIKEDEE